MAYMAIIEEELWIELVCSTYCIEMHHCLCLAIPAHIPRSYIVDYPVFWGVVVNILGVVFFLVNYHMWYELMAISFGKDKSCATEGRSLSLVWVLHILSTLNNL